MSSSHIESALRVSNESKASKWTMDAKRRCQPEGSRMFWRGIGAHRESDAQALRIMTFMHVRPPTTCSGFQRRKVFWLGARRFFSSFKRCAAKSTKKDSFRRSDGNDSVIGLLFFHCPNRPRA